MPGRRAAPGVPAAGRAVLLLVLVSVLVAAPAAAAAKYSQGSPAITAAVTGTNELAPGEEAVVQVLVQNNGVNLFKQVNAAPIAQEDLPSTAMYVTLGLSSPTPLLTVKTDPQFVGSIPGGGESVKKSFTVRVSADATEREYELPLFVSYRYPVVTSQESSDAYQFVYATENVTIPLAIRVRSVIRTEVTGIVAENLSAGSEGYLSLLVRNAGQEAGTGAVVSLTRNGNSPVIPVDSSVYVGDIPAGQTIAVRYKVAVSDGAEAQAYPVDVSIAYRDSEGALRTAAFVTVGVNVVEKPAFGIVSSPPQVAAGSSTTITVRYRNTGTTTVYDAQARITAHDPVAIDDNMAFLGDIGPSGEKDASFVVRADGQAEPGEYSFDSSVRYRDAYGNSVASDTVAVRIDVLPAGQGLLSGPAAGPAVIAVLLIAILACGALLLYRSRNGKR